jgi:hypothetical protein
MRTNKGIKWKALQPKKKVEEKTFGCGFWKRKLVAERLLKKSAWDENEIFLTAVGLDFSVTALVRFVFFRLPHPPASAF